MKRKFTNVFFLVAISIAALTSFVSCKDYEADLRMENDLSNALLKDQLAALQAKLTSEVARLEALQQQCAQNCSTARVEIWNNFDNYYKKTEVFNKTEINNLLGDYYTKAQTYSKAEVDALIANLATSGAVADKIDEAKEAADQAKDAVDDLAEELENNYVTKPELAAKVLELEGKISAAQTAADQAKQAAADALAAAQNAQATADQAVQNAADALAAAQAAQGTADNAAAAAAAAQEVADAAKALAESLEPRVAALETAVEGLNTTVAAIQEEMKNFATKARVEEVADSARTAYANAQSALEKVDALREEYEAAKAALEAKDAELAQQITENFDSINNRCSILHDSIDMVRAEAYALALITLNYVDEVEENLNYRIDSLAIDTRERIAGNTVKIKELANEIQLVELDIEDLQDRLDAVEADLEDLKPRVELLEDQVDEIYGLIDNLNDRLNKLITGIIVQATFNPVYGTFATPWGIESNFLAAYYGKNITGIDEFPTSTPNYFYNGEATLTDEDIAVFGSNEITVGDENGNLFIDEDGNAGTIYLTVNSASQQDFTNTQFELVNSQDEASPVTLGKLKKSDYKKVFGITTRAADNGFYEAEATIKSDFAKAAPKINLSQNQVKEILSDIKANASSPSKINFANIAGAVYKAATSDILPAYGIKAPWTDSAGDHAVYSAYNVAATAIKPLSFAFLSDINPQRVPGLDRIENFVGSFIDGINISIPTFNINNLQAPTIEHITLESLDENMMGNFIVEMKLDTTITVPGRWVNPVIDPIKVQVNGRWIEAPYVEVEIPQVDPEPQDVYISFYDEVSGNWVEGWTTIDLDPIDVDQPYVFIDDIWVPGSTQWIYPNVNPIWIDETSVHLLMTRKVDLRDAVHQLYDKMTTPIANVNQMIDDMNSFLDNVNDALQELNKVNQLNQQIEDTKQSFKDKLASYLDAINNRLLPFLTPSRYLQPILLGESNGSALLLSQAVTNPTKVSSTSISFIPTTLNAEIFSPAYKKWVAVTDVFTADRSASAKGGNAACQAARSAANAGKMNKVLDGNKRRVSTTLKQGYIYEISYQAMDYSGYVSAKKYYVKVK
ncbi:MAG: hypothetical protein J5545_00875 [Bacteroidaceae bacterium]|nr:hypothetical protein [Bacteroidaceae bacterium]